MTTQSLNDKSTTRFLLLSLTNPVFLPFLVSALRSLKLGRVGRTFRQVTSFITGVEETCLVCSTASTHSLYVCHQFKTLPHDLMINTVNTLVLHELPQDQTDQAVLLITMMSWVSEAVPHSPACESKGKESHKFLLELCSLLHLTLLFLINLHLNLAYLHHNSDPNPCGRSVLSHVAQSVTHCAHSLLMAACVLISFPRSTSIQAKAVLNSAFSSSFISEHLTQLLQHPHSKHSVQIMGT